MKHELIALESHPEIIIEFKALFRLLMHSLVKNHERRLTRRLGAIHRSIGIPD